MAIWRGVSPFCCQREQILKVRYSLIIWMRIMRMKSDWSFTLSTADTLAPLSSSSSTISMFLILVALISGVSESYIYRQMQTQDWLKTVKQSFDASLAFLYLSGGLCVRIALQYVSNHGCIAFLYSPVESSLIFLQQTNSRINWISHNSYTLAV